MWTADGGSRGECGSNSEQHGGGGMESTWELSAKESLRNLQ